MAVLITNNIGFLKTITLDNKPETIAQIAHNAKIIAMPLKYCFLSNKNIFVAIIYLK